MFKILTLLGSLVILTACASTQNYRLTACTEDQKAEIADALKSGVNLILSNYQAPRKDGNQYKGKLSFFINESGLITDIFLDEVSGNEALDNAFLEALKTASPLPLPESTCARERYVSIRKNLYYDETDMVD